VRQGQGRIGGGQALDLNDVDVDAARTPAFVAFPAKLALDAAALAGEGTRVLVDRLWPRGMKKEDAPFQLWIKDVAPSNTLRQWFGHAPERWPEFRKQYETELSANLSALQPLLDIARQGPLTLLYAAHDETHNNAVVLAEYLQHLLSPRKSD